MRNLIYNLRKYVLVAKFSIKYYFTRKRFKRYN